MPSAFDAFRTLARCPDCSAKADIHGALSRDTREVVVPHSLDNRNMLRHMARRGTVKARVG